MDWRYGDTGFYNYQTNMKGVFLEFVICNFLKLLLITCASYDQKC